MHIPHVQLQQISAAFDQFLRLAVGQRSRVRLSNRHDDVTNAEASRGDTSNGHLQWSNKRRLDGWYNKYSPEMWSGFSSGEENNKINESVISNNTFIYYVYFYVKRFD